MEEGKVKKRAFIVHDVTKGGWPTADVKGPLKTFHEWFYKLDSKSKDMLNKKAAYLDGVASFCKKIAKEHRILCVVESLIFPVADNLYIA